MAHNLGKTNKIPELCRRKYFIYLDYDEIAKQRNWNFIEFWFYKVDELLRPGAVSPKNVGSGSDATFKDGVSA